MRKIAAVVVTYNNHRMLNNLLLDLGKQTESLNEIIVVDNSTTNITKEMISNKYPEIIYIRLAENQGSAGGFYEGLKAAIIDNDLIWTLDDDVRLNSNALESLLMDLERLNHVKNIGVIRSGGSNDSSGIPKEMNMYTWRGSLFIADALNKVGLPNKKYFIYGEDLEHSIRLKNNGFKLYWGPSSKIREVRDCKLNKAVLGKTSRAYIEYFRFYYAFRNEINIYISYGYVVNIFKILFYALKIFFYIIFFEKKNCLHKIYAICSGIFDGIRGKLGKNLKFLPE